MLDWISKKKNEQKRKAEREEALKRSLSEKLAQYEQKQEEPVDDHTELLINGKKLRVPKELIDLADPVS